MNKAARYEDLLREIRGLIAGVKDPLANYANTVAAIYHTFPDINWAGFYFFKDGKLVLGPFQGRPACVFISAGKGVCGTASETKTTLVVEDVLDFPGHIACDARSRSEIVVPLMHNSKVSAVLDIDSPVKSYFDRTDKKYLEAIVSLLEMTLP
ncbi:MAG: GAF domain-containing protein [Candidatus Marinimicrobia bacterium]|nr:GAF domain-containing protein [Candidatus Neomarinimicrobiota bacterium]